MYLTLNIGLRYDLAELFLQQGHTAMALEEFRRVYEMDPDYRDVAARHNARLALP